jgi:type IV secretion system protein VirB11
MCHGTWISPGCIGWSLAEGRTAVAQFQRTPTNSHDGPIMSAPLHAVATGPAQRDTALRAYLAPLRPWLDAPGVTDLAINRPGEVFVEQHARWLRHDAPALTFEHLQALARALATFTGQHIDEQHPLLSATLPRAEAGSNANALSDAASGGERVQVVGPPAVDAHTVALCIRKPSVHQTTLDSLARGRLGAAPSSISAPTDPLSGGIFNHRLRDTTRLDPVDEELLALQRSHHLEAFLRLAVQHRRTIVVAGRTGAGKTTLMRALIEEIPSDERLITIEDAAELFMPRHANALHLFYSRGDQGAAKVTASSLLEACLRLRPERILLAEMRGEEAFAFLRLAASGHPGSLTSVHAGSAELAFDQIALMARQSPAGKGLTLPELLALARSVIDIVVHMDIDAGGRFVSGIHFDPLAKLQREPQT